MAFAFGDVILVPFPFTDQSAVKKRPAVIVSSSGYNANRRGSRRELVGRRSHQAVRLKPIVTSIEQSLILRTMGALSVDDLRTLRKTITQIIG